ncbi:MAG: hypothetical protein JRF02_09240 [Deltaproteobacteria bacterium]|jgi:predicted lipoprotein with Yx(FWY)xxD motif|nr:hypothetical protein [Deltaproteobacteria bacterium]
MQNCLSKITLMLFSGLLAAFFLLPVNLNASDSNEAGIKIMQKEVLGSFLAAGNGMTLYAYSRDEKNVSSCIEGCARNWPPYYAGPSLPAEGLEDKDFATITRDDGSKQTTYKGMPLYRFIKDRYPGDVFGNGLGGVWSIVKP